MVAGQSAREVARRRREKARRLEAMADAYERGAAGEEATAVALAFLPAGWTVLHDVRWPGRPRANIDHVVIGPGGIFALDSKHWAGTVTVTDGVLRQNGRAREREVAGAAEAALAVTAVIANVPVVPVLCFVRDEPVVGWARDVMVCSTGNVVDLLLSRPPILHQAAVDRLVPILTRNLVPATTATPQTAPLVSPGQPSPARPPRTRTRRPTLWGSSAHGDGPRRMRRFAVALAAGLLLLALLPTITGALTDAASRRVQQVIAPSKPIGATQTVAAAPGHPELAVAVSTVVDTQVAGRGPTLPAGKRLVAVQVRIENKGDARWTWGGSARLTLVDHTGATHSATAAYPKVTAGPLITVASRVRPHHALTGSVVFEVAGDVRVDSVRFEIGPGLPKTLRWTL